jgi:hypothetical protein
MGKRLHDTEIWDEDWFQDLPNKYKLFFSYIKDKCDNVGIWRPNKNNFQKTVGEPIVMDEFLMLINQGKGRIAVLPSGKWFLRDFFCFQYGHKFTPTSPVHRGALKQLVANGLTPTNILGVLVDDKIQHLDLDGFREIAYSKDINTLLVSFGYHTERTKAISKDKDKILNKNSIVIEMNENSINDIESYLLSHDNDLDAICAAHYKKREDVLPILKKFHLWNVSNQKYPKPPLALIAGLKSWILNEKQAVGFKQERKLSPYEQDLANRRAGFKTMPE